MDRAAAAVKVRKLRALADPERGGTPAERAVATEMAKRLIDRHRLLEHELFERTARPRGFTAPRRGPARAWSFDPRTGEASGAVKVHSWTDRFNWRIEIPADGFGARSAERREAIDRLMDAAGRRRLG